MKKILIRILVVLAVGCINIKNINAATGSISISSVSSTVTGNSITVTVKATAANNFYWQLFTTYDTTLLKLISGTTTIQGEADDAVNGVSSVSSTYKFTALKTGTAFIKVASGAAGMNINTQGESISYVAATKNIKITAPTPKSTNNNLSALLIDGVALTPEFNKNTLDYSATLEPNTTLINIKTALEDSKAKITGSGETTLVEGLNTIPLVVTAENGSTKTYTLSLTVKELDPITIKVDGVEYKIIRKADQLDAFTSFQAKVITYEENDIPALYNEIIKYTIIGAKDEAGNKLYFKYDEKAKTFTRYQEIKFEGAVFNPLTTDKKPLNEKYKATTIKINGVEVKAYKINKKSEFALIYGVNVEDGHEGFYLYDAVGNTIQRYNAEEFTLLNQDIKYYFIVIIAFGIGLFLSFALVFAILYTKSKNKKKKDAIKEKLVEQPETIDNKGKKKDIKQINNVKEAKEKLKEIKQKAEASEETEEMFQLLEKK